MGGKGRGEIRGESGKVNRVVADVSIMDKRYGAMFFILSVTSN